MRLCTVADELRLDDDLLIAGDNAQALARLPEEAFDLVYMDPPFNTGRSRTRDTVAVQRDTDAARVGFGGRTYSSRLLRSLTYEDSFAADFSIGGVALRISTVADFTPHGHTILGFNVPDVAAAVKALREKGVTFNLYPRFHQDELGIWTAPGGTVRVAWFKDPDDNILSITQS